MSEKPKKVLIAVPTLGLEQDPQKWLTMFLTVINDIRKNQLTHACFFPYRMTWWPSNNEIWQAAFQNDFDYILRMDDDVWGAPLNAFSQLYAADKDVIGASYPIRQFPYSLCAFYREDKEMSLVEAWKTKNQEAMAEVSGTGIQPCDLVGFGMTLIKVAPFKMIERPIYKGEEDCPDDTYFAQLCLDNKIQQYVNLDVKLCHREVTPINRMYLFNADVRVLIRAGMIKRGNKFHDRLINTYGEDGMKDFSELKGLEVSRILRPA